MEMRSWNMESFMSSARLHDLGKILVPDSFTSHKAYDIIMNESGRHFDPQIASVFDAVREEIETAKHEALTAR